MTRPPAEPLTVYEATSALVRVVAELRDELALVRAERNLHAQVLAERDELTAEIHLYQKANLLLLDREMQRTGVGDPPRHEAPDPAAVVPGAVDVALSAAAVEGEAVSG